MGTPNETVWKDVNKLKDFKATFPKWKGGELNDQCDNSKISE